MSKVIPLTETNMTLRAEIEIDGNLLLHSRLSPEKMIDIELEAVKQAMLDAFYGRFPGERNANS